ncbi:hypothetical protein HOP50_15g74840 [Chloropicon primus]|uniref:DUF2470 domain-containing protein n=2 Tax=Chloropicon primus TaxID=1764295 RepID=A0A5B8MX86_9CHLO|nr:hypothetical protein A3770_15p74590 [Chloropicon primus]UPR04150.1 hypothetical protein HOP50_15g74840 [Chloropicon primus]|mmetsp:Transcript_6253/g.18593  ORF Transcript_6253/g.18593 Transcript_6253/m.18593 type:complete len:146 (+) Transcript_6253:209-646(+)|eukprot:QDZ24941.1 hypothetical protein A3770_15p74590 [Chloropicon primus]
MAKEERGSFGDASRAVAHMNDDHFESLVAWVHHYLKVPTHLTLTDVILVDCTEEGMHLMVHGDWRLIEYPKECEVKTARDLRKVAVFMHNEAFSKLGLSYRIKHGYYGSTAAYLAEKAKQNKHILVPALATAALALAYYRRMKWR